MKKQKNILIIRACGIAGEAEECDNIKCQAKLYGIDVADYCPKDTTELYDYLMNHITSYDYIYLSSHGNAHGFGNESGSIAISWREFGTWLCESRIMKADCIVLLSCCRGGLNQVAYDLFYCCNNISYIVGPRQSLYPRDMLIGFNLLLFNLEHRGIDPIVACEKIKAGTDIRFVCFDKLETETDASYKMHVYQYEKEELEAINKARKSANEPLIETPKEVIAMIPKIQILD